MGYVGNEPSVNFTSFAKQDITGDGGANYTLTYAVANANEIEVFVNNVRQEPTSAYSVSGTALTMTGNVASTDDFYVIYLGKALQTTVTPDGSVTPTKIASGYGLLPSGTILMWNGTSGNIPTGFVICDGNNSTPNLTDKFIKASSTAGTTGGSSTSGATTLTIAQMPAHTHAKSPYAPGSAAASVASSYNSFFDSTTGVTQSTGGGGSHTHSIEPPYYSLIFIMKT